MSERDPAGETRRASPVSDALPLLLHEVKNPLAAVNAALELLVEETDGQVRQDVLGALAAARRATEALCCIGACSAGIAGDAPIDVLELLHEQLQRLGPEAREQGVDLCLEAQRLPPLAVNAPCLKALFSNMVRSALEQTRACRLTLSLQLAAGRLRIALRVPAPTPATTPTPSARSGLGWGLCQRIALAAGTELETSTQPGGGTRAELLIPVPMSADLSR